MPYIIGAMAFGLVSLILLRMFVKASPRALAGIIRVAGSAVFAGAGLFLLSRGAVWLSLPLFAIAAASYLGLGLGSGGAGGRKRDGQSRVRTSMLSMKLDHASGGITGEVLKGSFMGRSLSDLELPDLLQLREECVSAGDQSAALLDAFLDQINPDWRDAAEGEAAKPGTTAGGSMTHDQARDILGVDDKASADEIRQAHRDMMKKFHPDHGGSDYLAARINEAKDLLLGQGG